VLDKTGAERGEQNPGPWYIFNDAISYLLIHVYLVTQKATRVNYSHRPAKAS